MKTPEMKNDPKTGIPSGFLTVLFVISIFLSAFTSIRDTEAWLHLSLGRLIWDLKGVPDVEFFTYPTLGEPFSYNSWLFGLLCYGLNTILGPLGLVLLKATAITATFYILLKDSLRPYNNYAVALILIVAAAVLSSYRFVLRPDLLFILFLSFSVFSLNAFLYDGKKYIYALPLVHLLWANVHASIIVMFAPFVAFIGGGLTQRYLEKRNIEFDNTPSYKQLQIMALVFVASLMATLVTPYSFGQYFFGPQYLYSAWHTKHIIEMLPPKNPLPLYGISAVVLISFFLNRKKFSITHLLLVIPFIYLVFSAVRFIFLIAIIGFPVVARNIAASRERRGLSSSHKKAATAVAAVCIFLYGSICLIFAVKHNRFGYGFDYSWMPKNAVEYMDANGIYGKMLNTYHFGQYIIWKSYPKRPVFTDARGHLPEDLLKKLMGSRYSSSVLDKLYETYGFNSILFTYNRPYYGGNESPPILAPSSHSQWTLVYWDDVSLLYLRRVAEYSNLIGRDEYVYVKPEMPLLMLVESPPGEEEREKLIEELKRNISETSSARAHVLLGYIYYEEGLFEDSHKHLSAAMSLAPRYPNVHFVLGLLYLKQGDFVMSEKHLKKCLKLMPSGPLAGKSRELLEDIRKR